MKSNFNKPSQKSEATENLEDQKLNLLLADFFEDEYYPDHVMLNKQLQPLLIEWSETKTDRRLTGDFITYFKLENSWHSPDNLHELEPFHELRDYIENTIYQKLNVPLKIVTMWSIVGKKTLSAEPHKHRGKTTGVYYVDNGHSEGEAITGQINFHTPDGVKKIEPLNGKLLLFPSKLEHSVDTYLGSKHRIIISFNMQ